MSNCHFPSPHARPREQQIGDVGTADDEHQSHCAEEEQQRLTNVADDVVLERHETDCPLTAWWIIRRILLAERRNEDIDPPLCLSDCLSGFEPGDRAGKVIAPKLVGRQREAREAHRRPHFGAAFFLRSPRRLKSGRHDADDAVRVGIELHDAAEDMRIAAERAPPEPVADDNLFIEARRRIRGIEGGAELRFHSEQREVVRRDDQQSDTLRPRETGEIVVVEPGRRDILEDTGPLEILPFRRRHADVLRAHAKQIVLDSYELFGVRKRQRVQQRGVDNTENGRRRADSEGDRENGDRSEGRRTAQHAKPDAHVLTEAFQCYPGPSVARDLLHEADISELASRIDRGIACRLAARDAIRFRHLEVPAEFIGELSRATFTHPRQPLDETHVSASVGGCIRPAIASDNRSHFDRSAARRVRPFGVRRYMRTRRSLSDIPHSAAIAPWRISRWSAG